MDLDVRSLWVNEPMATCDYVKSLLKFRTQLFTCLLICSHVSGTTLLGLPAEVYRFGSQYMACAISALFCCIIIIYVYLPVFYKLQIMSSYEYLKIRFDGRVRSVASFLYVLATVLHTPVFIYIPALALNQGTVFTYLY